MKTINSAIYLAAIFVLGLALSCSGGSSATNTDYLTTPVSAAGPQTSSDMNISPANSSVSDPMYDGNDSIKRADSLKLNKPNN
ncbi:hypothetical protein AM493_06210 [Flavobacterium akiainvivens]|uniref:Cytochrome C551 n=1 Tax=Flavobacterium akiainvivens TaxID=1202724 RepID=A0A0M8MGB6_9FLAO|nr:hypothetical protein [Flavobacterium akiainvivens]KOS05671.1 hypothetical protein AM493_06210 [Flavobacterium akiainvivens]SFQ36415.1 hypothetical protein SAMN05444144_103280 [Flavobacterium akiainvivens]